MITWEFFAGSRSFSKEASKRGFVTYTTDIEPFEGIDQISNIFDFDIDLALAKTGKPDIIWFSPPCNKFSIASCFHHWDKIGSSYVPKSEGAKIGLLIMEKVNEIIEKVKPNFFIIENPRGLMRKMEPFKKHIRQTVWYCQYGGKTAKPTDLWTNFRLIVKTCKNYKIDKNGEIIDRHCHHEVARRGENNGIQGLKGNYERSKVPSDLINSILDQIQKPILRSWFV